jgi:hypothetical protein
MKVFHVTEEELYVFIKSLEPKLKRKEVQDEINKSVNGKSWDNAARHIIGERMYYWFKEHFGSRTLGDKWENCFGYEGQNRNIKRTKIFSSSAYPDMYFLKPFKIAIELDHGRTGSKLKNALTKAGFDKLSEDWNKVFVVFFDESDNKRIKESLKDKESRKGLKFFQESLNTDVIVI